MRELSFWLLAVPFFLMVIGVWKGWVAETMESVRFSRAQVDVRDLGKVVEEKHPALEGPRPDLMKALKGTEEAKQLERLRDPWNTTYHAAMLLDGTGKVVFFSNGPDGVSSFSERSNDDIFAGNEFDSWAEIAGHSDLYRNVSLIAGGFFLSQIIARVMGRRPLNSVPK